MKRFFGWWMAVCVVLAGCCGCGRQGLPVPEFPLEADVVEAALERAGLPWTIAAEESWAEGHTVHTLHDPEGRMVAIVSSTGEPQGRMLRLSFLPSENDPYGVSVSLPAQDWEKAVILGTILYGGFAEEREVYTAFLATRNDKSAAVQRGEPARAKPTKRLPNGKAKSGGLVVWCVSGSRAPMRRNRICC